MERGLQSPACAGLHCVAHLQVMYCAPPPRSLAHGAFDTLPAAHVPFIEHIEMSRHSFFLSLFSLATGCMILSSSSGLGFCPSEKIIQSMAFGRAPMSETTWHAGWGAIAGTGWRVATAAKPCLAFHVTTCMPTRPSGATRRGWSTGRGRGAMRAACRMRTLREVAKG